MKVDVSKSIYHEDPQARKKQGFSRQEMKHLRLILRRLRFLEQQVRESGGLASGSASGGAAFAEWEVDALEWILGEMEFLRVPHQLPHLYPTDEPEPEVSGNSPIGTMAQVGLGE